MDDHIPLKLEQPSSFHQDPALLSQSNSPTWHSTIRHGLCHNHHGLDKLDKALRHG